MTKIEGYVGLARRGGFITFGEDMLFKVQKRRVSLVLLSSDCGWRAKRDIELLNAQTLILVTHYTKEELGTLVGARPLNAIGITSPGIARQIHEEIRKEGEADVQIEKQEE